MAINLIPQRAFSNDDMATDTFTATAGQTVFTLSRGATLNAILVHVNDVIQQPSADYTLSSATLTFNTGLTVSDDVRVRIMTERPLGSAAGASGATTLGALNDVSSAGASTGQVLKWSGTQWAPGTDLNSGGGGGGIALTDLSVGSEGTPAGNGLIAYNNSTGSFSYTPAVLNGLSATGDVDFGSNKILYSNLYANVGDLPSAGSYHGMFAHVHGTGKGYYAHAGAWIELANKSELTLDGLTGVSTSGVSSGQVLKYNGTSWAPASDASGSGGIALSDLSVGSEGTASGDGAIAYNNSTGVFTYTPPVIGSEVPLPDDQEFTVTAAGSGAYTFAGAATGNNPTITLQRGKTYKFTLNASGHPFRIQSTTGTSGTLVTNGVHNNTAQVGTIYYSIPDNAPDTLFYQCSNHSAMNGTINVIDKIVPGHTIQTVHGVNNDNTNTTSSSFVATNIAATITPYKASSKILVLASFSARAANNGGADANGSYMITHDNGTTNLATARIRHYDYGGNGGLTSQMINMNTLHSPNTTSATTYKIYYQRASGHNFEILPNNNTITLMEIAQ